MPDLPNKNEIVFESQIPFDSTRMRAAAVYCSDGRFGLQFDDFVRNSLNLPKYDRLAVPGGAACLAGHFATYREEEAIVEQLRFLVAVHELEQVALIAHSGCAFYSDRLNVSPLQMESQQQEDLSKAVRRVKTFSRELIVAGYFARRMANGKVRFEGI